MLFFDIETTGLLDSSLIVVAVTRTAQKTTVWAEKTVQPLSPENCDRLATEIVTHDGRVVSFNGASFDFRILCQRVTTAKLRQALVHTAVCNHCDIMLDFLSNTGYCASLQSFLQGCHLSSKVWCGNQSAELCLQSEEYFQKTIRYCTGDVTALEELITFLHTNGYLARQTKRGAIVNWVPFAGNSIRTVADCVAAYRKCPIDTKWMTTPGPTPETSIQWIATLSKTDQLK